MAALRWIWAALKRAGAWLRDNPIALAASIGSIVGAYFMWKSRKNKIDSLEDALAVQATKTKIAKAEAKAEQLEASAAAREPEIVALEREIIESKKRVLEIHEKSSLKDKTDSEIADMFSKSGL